MQEHRRHLKLTEDRLPVRQELTNRGQVVSADHQQLPGLLSCHAHGGADLVVVYRLHLHINDQWRASIVDEVPDNLTKGE